MSTEAISTRRSAHGFDTEPGEDWRDNALCAQIDPELFFPDKGGSSREAKLVCSLCPVQTDCLQHALTARERFGVWGGLSERERRSVERCHRSPVITASCGTPAGATRHYKHGESLCQPCRFAVRAESAFRHANGGVA